METFVFAIVVLTLVLVFFFTIRNNRDKSQDISYIPTDPRESDPRLNKFNVMGVRHYNVSLKDIGRFSGYAISETNNKYDEFAVAFFKSNGVQIGHARRETDYLHRSILEQGGRLDLIGDIYLNTYTGNLQADVYIDYKNI